MSLSVKKCRGMAVVASASVFFGWLLRPVRAATTGLEDFASQAGYNTNQGADSLIKTVSNIVKTGLTLLGFIFVLLTLYAGFLWMTAQGEEEKITTAKNILTGAVIGLVIIVLAYGITAFVVNAVAKGATGGLAV